MWCYKRTNQEW